jgi:arylsulfatase A-like enzyme
MPDPRPNILWLCTDQQRYDTIGALGNPYLRTPHIDRLVETGVAFTHAYCQSPICTPSRASFLTGTYPSTVHGCINGNDRWSDAAPLITKTLAEAGYDCGLAGKLHLAGAHGRIEPRPDDGYRVFHWSHHPRDDWPEGHAYVDWLKSEGHDYKTLYEQHGHIPKELHQTTWCTDRAIDFMRERRDGPWLFSFNCYDPHPPFDPPEEYVRPFDIDRLPGPLFRDSDLEAQRRLAPVVFQSEPAHPDSFDGQRHQARYWAQIALIDENVGRMMRALAETGQRENTIVIFMSDHGDMVGDHGLRFKGCRFYEGLVRVPLIFSWPGTAKRKGRDGLRSDALVELTDLAPTLREAAGLPPDERLAGRSLLPMLTGAADPSHHRDFVRCEYFQAITGPPSYATMIRDRRHKLVTYHGHDLGELFDLEADPGEFENLWDDPGHAAVRFDLMKRSFDALALAVDIGPPRVVPY